MRDTSNPKSAWSARCSLCIFTVNSLSWEIHKIADNSSKFRKLVSFRDFINVLEKVKISWNPCYKGKESRKCNGKRQFERKRVFQLSICTYAASPLKAANCSRLKPFLFLRLRSIFGQATRTSAAAVRLSEIASWKGVSPSLSCDWMKQLPFKVYDKHSQVSVSRFGIVVRR